MVARVILLPTSVAMPLPRLLWQLGASVRLFVSISNPDAAEILDYIFLTFPTYSLVDAVSDVLWALHAACARSDCCVSVP